MAKKVEYDNVLKGVQVQDIIRPDKRSGLIFR